MPRPPQPLPVPRCRAILCQSRQVLAQHDADAPGSTPNVNNDLYLTYTCNRIQACRFDLDGLLIELKSHVHRPRHFDVLSTCERLAVHAKALKSTAAVGQSAGWVEARANDARWMREPYSASESLPDLMWKQAERRRNGG